MPIRRLPPLLVNQIAAGEVIERPASVVKELVENSIDAGASRIEVSIEQGGCELIRVSDDGAGIEFDELPLAVAAHATSKIAVADDLDSIATMGFRGEALASIASVSRLSIASRPHSAPHGGVVDAEGDQVAPPRPCGMAPGTVVAARNLFFNTPARRKFLRSERAEAARVADLMDSLALAQPAIGFQLAVDSQIRLDLPPNQSPKNRALDVLGHELAPELLELDRTDRGLCLWGLIGKPTAARATAKHQRIYLNGRPIIDRSVNHAIKEAYRGLIEPTRWPTVLLFMSMDPSQVDVNVHPTKAEVRFRAGNVVHGVVLSAIREVLGQADLTPEFGLASMRPWSASVFQPSREAAGALPPPNGGWRGVEPSAAAFVDHFRRLDPSQKGFVYSEVRQAMAMDPAGAAALDADPPAPQAAESFPQLRTVADVMQVHSSYIVTQDESGLVIIDQHALHERVMFEKLKARITSGDLESQRLLMPAVVEADSSQMAALDQIQWLLRRLGIEADAIGPASVAIHSFTSLLFERGVDPVEFMSGLLAKAAAQGLNDDAEAALDEVLDMMACKAAIKAGDRLAPDELAELLKLRLSVERSSNCPHGRPTSLRLSLKELDKRFGRT